jgi:hypothetical protein
VKIPDDIRSNIEFWEHAPHGLDYSRVRCFAVQQLHAVDLEPEMLLAEPKPFLAVNLRDAMDLFAEGTARYDFASSAGIEALGVWFRAELAPDQWISNAPPNAAPSWRHGLFPLFEPMDVAAGDTINVRLSTYNGQIWRWQSILQRPGQAELTVDHSTFAGFPLDLAKIRASDRQVAPVLSRRGEATLRTLHGFDGYKTSEDLAEMLKADYADLFPTETSARMYVSKVVELCCRSDDA